MARKTRQKPRSDRAAPAAPPPRLQPDPAARRADVARRMNDLSLYALALVILYRPLKTGIVTDYGSDAMFGTILLVSLVCWLGALVLGPERTARLPGPWRLGAGVLLLTAVSIMSAHYLFPALYWTGLMGGYLLTWFLVAQHAHRPRARRILIACAVATVVTLGAYGLFHYAVYMPAMRRWFESDPEYFKNMLEARGALVQDLRNRLIMPRAHGNYLTPNQLSDILLIGLFMTVSVLPVRGRRLRTGLLAAAAALLVVAIVLGRSNGAAVGLVGALGFLAVTWALRRYGPRLGRRGRIAATVTAVALGVLAAGLLITLVRGRHPILHKAKASLGVRLGYWDTTVDMIRRRPLTGIGPGNWNDLYSVLKGPAQEETQLPHSDYLQIAAESGVPTALIYLGFLATCIVAALRRGGPEPEAPDDVSEPALYQRDAIVLILMAALCFSFDLNFIGTFSPPSEGTGMGIFGHAWVAYLGLFILWTLIFGALSGPRKAGTSGRAQWLMAAGAVGFAVHSAGDFLLVIGGIGTVVFLVLGLLTTHRARERRPSQVVRYALFTIFTIGTIMFCLKVTQRVLIFQISQNVEFALRSRVAAVDSVGSPAYRDMKAVMSALEDAAKAVPIEADTINRLGSYNIRHADVLARSGKQREAYENMMRAFTLYKRAARLDPLKGKYRLSLAGWYERMGRQEEAVRCYRAAAELSPSRPLGWFLYASAVGRAEPEGGRAACEAFRKALELSPKQYHTRNRLTDVQKRVAEDYVRRCDNR